MTAALDPTSLTTERDSGYALRMPSAIPAQDRRPTPWRRVLWITTIAGLVSGARLMLVYRASGIRLTPFEGLVSGIMEWWIWIPLAPIAFRIADRYEPRPALASARMWKIVGVHGLGAVVLTLTHLFLFSSLSGLVRTWRFGDPFRVDVVSPLIVLFVPGLVVYAIFVVSRWWSSSWHGAAAPDARTGPSASPEPNPANSTAGCSSSDPAQRDSLPVGFQAGRGTLHLRPEEIDWVRAAGNYLELHGGHGTHLVRETLKRAQERLGPERFVRIHRSTLVRSAAVVGLVEGRQPAVLLGDGTKLPIGASFLDLVSKGFGC